MATPGYQKEQPKNLESFSTMVAKSISTSKIFEPIRKLNTLESILKQEGISYKNMFQKAMSFKYPSTSYGMGPRGFEEKEASTPDAFMNYGKHLQERMVTNTRTPTDTEDARDKFDLWGGHSPFSNYSYCRPYNAMDYKK